MLGKNDNQQTVKRKRQNNKTAEQNSRMKRMKPSINVKHLKYLVENRKKFPVIDDPDRSIYIYPENGTWNSKFLNSSGRSIDNVNKFLRNRNWNGGNWKKALVNFGVKPRYTNSQFQNMQNKNKYIKNKIKNEYSVIPPVLPMNHRNKNERTYEIEPKYIKADIEKHMYKNLKSVSNFTYKGKFSTNTTSFLNQFEDSFVVFQDNAKLRTNNKNIITANNVATHFDGSVILSENPNLIF
jgi:hypothetical protein